jgi:hypothetical protein
MDSQQAVGAALGIAARVPVLLWGAPGTGKTSVITAMAAAAGWPCETVLASIREPSDFAGLPVMHRGTAPGQGAGDAAHGQGAASASVEFAPPRWAVTLAAAGHGLVFFDEISTAPPAVQAALLRVVLERTVGDLTLPAPVSVAAAANPPEQAADGWDLSAPLANRLCHLDWPVDPGTGLPDLPDGWDDRIPVTRSWIAGFFTVRPPLVLAPPGARGRVREPGTWPRDCVPGLAPDLPADLGCEPGWLAERHFDQAAGGARRWDCGSGADGSGRPGDDRPGDADPGSGIGPAQAELLRLGVAAEIGRQHSRLPGSVPAGWLRWAKSVLPSRVDWRRVLAAEVRGAVAAAAGKVDYSYRRPARRAHLQQDLIIPALRRRCRTLRSSATPRARWTSGCWPGHWPRSMPSCARPARLTRSGRASRSGSARRRRRPPRPPPAPPGRPGRPAAPR